MSKTQQKRLNKEDFRIDWKHYPIQEEDGSITYDDCSEYHDIWLEEDCGGNEAYPIGKDQCIAYYEFEYDKERIKQYERQNDYSDEILIFWGLQQMFNDGWIKSPAFVNWKSLYLCINPRSIGNFIEGIYERKTGVEILKHLIKMADTIYPLYDIKDTKNKLKDLLCRYQAGAKEQARQQAEEKKKDRSKKEKLNYTITLDEIIEYAEFENTDSAPTIRAMLRYFKDTKDGWDTATIKKKINAIGDNSTTTINNVGNLNIGDNVHTKIVN